MLPMEFESPQLSPPSLLERISSRVNLRYLLAGIFAVLLLLLFSARRGTDTHPPPPFQLPSDSTLWDHRAEAVKGAFRHAYAGYERLAFPHDELRPVSGTWDDKA
jgi:hypothetical protein